MLTNEHLLQAFEAAGAGGGVIYVSVPITSGAREVALLQELGVSADELRRHHRRRWRSDVVDPNEDEAARHVEKVRAASSGRLVVDPSRLMVSGWSAEDYNGFWVKLMERHAEQVVVTPGWELSRGARAEVGYAVALGLPVLDIDGRALTLDDLAACDELARAGLRRTGWADDQVDAYLAPMDYVQRPDLPRSAASEVFDWLGRERQYQVAKFGTQLDDENTRAGLDEEGWWWRQLSTYYHRAGVLTLDNPLGRQALAKFAATACGLLESVARVHGPLPDPGVPSGEVEGQGG